MKEIKYALKLKKTGKLLTYEESSNEGKDFCGNITVELSTYGDRIWYADTPEQAEYVRHYSTEWYNAGYDTPNHPYDIEDLITVKVEIEIIEEEIKVKLPTFEEFARYKADKYGNPEKDFDFYMWQKKKHPKIHYDWHELKTMMLEKGKE